VVDGLRVALPGLDGGLLGGKAALGQPGAEVVGVVADAEPLVDQLGQAAGGPQLGGEAEGAGLLQQPAEDLPLVGRREVGGRPGVGLGLEAVGAVGPEGGEPAADGALGDAQEGSDVFAAPALLDPPDGETAALF